MAIFPSYAPPGVYTETLLDPSVSEALGTLRIPAYLGTAQEYKTVSDFELARGSSASRDNRKVGEDISYQADGSNRTFTTGITPIVDGSGAGIITYNPNDIEVYVNGVRVVVSQLLGATGTFILQLAPLSTDTVTINYYYKLTDTKVTDENVSDQADGVNVHFFTHFAPIVDGSNSGTPTTTTSDVTVKINGAAVTVNEVDGVNGFVILDSAPLVTDTVTITYYYNMHSNTADDLPQLNPIAFQRVGLSPGASDFTEGIDFVIVDNQIHWGTTYILASGSNTPGSILFDDTQISSTLVDQRVYLEDVSSQFTGVENYCTVAHTPIVDGSGRDTVTENPANVKVYINGVETVVTRIDGVDGKVFINTIPLVTDTVEVSYYRNAIVDQNFTIECKVSGVTGLGSYAILNESNTPLYFADVTATTGTPTWLRTPATHMTSSVDEVVTVTFTSATEFTVSSSNVSGTASGTTTTGKLGRTFIDDITGLNFTLSTSSTFILGDTITITVADTITVPVVTSATEYRYIVPGIRLLVNNTTNVAVGDTAILGTFDKSGEEPNVGDVYYITYTYEKVDADYEPKVFQKFREVIQEYGELSTQNPLTVAAYLAFINGSVGVITKQVIKQTGLETAADTTYILALSDLERPVEGILPSVIIPLTTSATVHDATRNHCNIMSSERYRSERVHLYGYAVGTEPQDAIAVAEGFRNERTWAVYPDGAIMALTDAYGRETESILDGSYLAAAIAGLNVNPAFDEATSMIRKNVVGFKRLIRRMNEVDKNQVSSGGVIVLEEVGGSIRVRDSLTTDLSNPFSKRPEVVTIRDKVQKDLRRALDSFIGTKILAGTQRDIESRVAATLRGLVERRIISKYDSNIEVVQDETDPSFFKVTAFYVPIFGLAYIECTLNLRTKL